MKVAVFGLGYVGTVTAACLADRGHVVVGVDVDRMKVDAIGHGLSPVVEPGLQALVEQGVAAGRLSATTEAATALEQADVSLLCVGTPSGPDGSADLTAMSRALADIRAGLDCATPPPTGLHCVVIRSTVPPGTGETVVRPVFSEGLPPGWDVVTAMCPEFLREGCGLKDFFAPPFVVVGANDDRAAATLDELFAFLGTGIHHIDVRSAEALKYACNAFHATKVSFANELARIFRPLGIDSRVVMSVFSEDRVLNISPTYLRPGFAYGGSCLPKDLRALQHMARMNGVDAPLLAGTSLTNELVIRELLDRIIAIDGRRVALLGLSFKMDTDDLRESPNVELAERLIGKGYDLRIYDPIVNPAGLVGANRRHVESKLPHLNRLLSSTPEEALRDAEIVIAATADAAAVRALAASGARVVFDINGRLGADIEQLPGYQGVGW